jgi:nucleotide-binding universal stress UspA family protein
MNVPIVAGTDGSEESLAAVQWAAVEAVQRRMPLCIVYVLENHSAPAARLQILRYEPHHWGWVGHDLPHGARSALARASHRAKEAAPGVELCAAAVPGHADRVLTAITHQAALLAIGTRGTGGFSGLRLGSVALCLAGRLDGYHNWVLSVDPVNKRAAALLSEQVAPWRRKYPDVIVTENPVRGHAGRVLAFASQSSDLIVVGGRKGLASSRGLSPVTYATLCHAQCPVAVIPGSIVPWTAAREDLEIARQPRAALGQLSATVTT